MRSIPVDVSAFTAWMVVAAPEPRVANMDTGEVRKDRSSGETIWSVALVAMRGRDSSVEQVSVVGEPRGLDVGMPVRPVGLEGTAWTMEGRSGISFRAERIVAMGQTAGTGPASANPATPPGAGSGEGRRAAGPAGGARSAGSSTGAGSAAAAGGDA